ncbi:MAG: isoprenylcysteine carboxylmethyltransferase family protein [Proteiniphilum sp.]|jgi:protein-S-isoprenylcysteine O-methyltransferase Ste14|uniref:methyltransferase family protein n=1 Tax=Proteiniphilum sp. TaxID=1926877 RepID=UPI002B2148AB|nr:isoprenylcysteine carboxylmethyltransferase family protein [Proteiniphilum sp.]MEA5129697.1 isoprenylcysteine carboxylmethyltransferase family protein [Proteiniphilum sp.]
MEKKKISFVNKALPARIVLTLLLTSFSVFIFGAVLFLSAWTLDWPKAWLFLIVFGLVSLITALIGVIKAPEIVDSRMAKHSDNQKWDNIVVSLLGVNTFILFIVAGIDNRFSLLISVPDILSFISLPFTSLYIIIQLWAGMTNKHFESHVRLQEGHNVVQTGPYKIVRHLFYSTFILFWLSTPLALGSFMALIPGLFGVILLIYRTSREDKFLQENLKGYKEYSEKVKYRLIPGIW